MRINVSHIDHAYQDSVRRYFVQEMPALNRTSEDTLEVVFDLMLATKQNRNGPKPNPEAQVNMRHIIREAIKANSAIPILIPWGSRKPDTRRIIDVAELQALKAIQCLHTSIQRFHPQGLDVRMRIEDATGFYMFQNEGGGLRAHSERYSGDLVKLIEIMDMDGFVDPFRESEHVDEASLFRVSNNYAEVLCMYLEESEYAVSNGHDPSKKALKILTDIGFKGVIPYEQREYYRNYYQKKYPHLSAKETNWMLAQYLASAMARRELSIIGTKESWNGFIKLSFINPVPGAPPDGALYYRTIPERYSRNHLAPWRGHGYLRISESGDATPAIASPNDILDLYPGSIELAKDEVHVTLEANYQLI